MKILICTILPAVLAVNSVTAQNTNGALYKYVSEKRKAIKEIKTVTLLKKAAVPVPASIKKVLTNATLLAQQNIKRTKRFFKEAPSGISFIVPVNENSFQLEMIKEDISFGKLTAGELTGKGSRMNTRTLKALHYRGYIKDDPHSIASISVFANGDIMGLFSNAGGNYNLGKIAGGNYIVYNDKDVTNKPGYECGTDETPAPGIATPAGLQQVNTPLAPNPVCNKVRIYWEANYKLYSLRFGNNFINTANYLSGIFNQMATMYQNEGIRIELSEVFIWTTPDTFTTTSSGTGLTAIRNRWNASGNNFNGDLCMLIDGGTGNNGGRAYLLTGNMCGRNFNYGYSNVYGTYNNVPAYSWDVEVLTHETGHNMGSHHTHWCGWNTGSGGTCGAIDDCSTLETTGGCPSCFATTTTNPAPLGFSGTVMSYCHLRSGIGINLSNGFGPLPRAAMQSLVNNSSSCLIQGSSWLGAVGTQWENAANWSCGNVPTASTDVTIPEGLINYPVVNSAAQCRKLYQEQGGSLIVNPAFSLKILGTE